MQDDKMSLDEFVSGLLNAKGISDTPEEHANLLEKVNAKVDQAILVSLPENDFNQISQLSNDPANEARIREILDNADIDAETITFDALKEFRDAYLGGE